MKQYEPRSIAFKEIITVGNWKVKLYTISKKDDFNAEETYHEAIKHLSEWLELKNSFDASHENMAFLMIHAGTEGVFSILNWWVGKNMLNTHIFLSNYSEPKQFKRISGDGLSPCIWEFEVINHERNSWIKNILKQPNNPDYNTYLKENYNGKI
ncbi:MAG: hypothetical protein ACPG5B_06615 [Chitinophagales bacterium]